MLTNLKRLLCCVLVAISLVAVLPTAAGATRTVATESSDPVETLQWQEDQVTRLYLTVLGRRPDAGGLAFWTQLRATGTSLDRLAQYFLDAPEYAEITSGDTIVDAYRHVLDRDPDAGGYEFWTATPLIKAVIGISESAEAQEKTDTGPPPHPAAQLAATRPDVPAGWVDAGHGVYVPPILLAIRWCESKDDYLAANRWSSARGGYQFLTSSWDAYGHADRYGVPQAHLATPAQQDEAAVLTWQRDGTRPWNASRHCWG